MKSKTEELLNLLLWSADMLLRPTFRNLTGSYESWAYKNGLLRQLARLEEQRIVERDSAWRDERIYRLTSLGRLQALGGRDPAEHWSRIWDGNWRLVLFDVPTTQNSRRSQLRRYLRSRGFLLGCVIFPTSGEVYIDNLLVNNLSEKELARVRLKNIGFVFQSFNLLAPLNVLENVMHPLRLSGTSKKEAKIRQRKRLKR